MEDSTNHAQTHLEATDSAHLESTEPHHTTTDTHSPTKSEHKDSKDDAHHSNTTVASPTKEKKDDHHEVPKEVHETPLKAKADQQKSPEKHEKPTDHKEVEHKDALAADDNHKHNAVEHKEHEHEHNETDKAKLDAEKGVHHDTTETHKPAVTEHKEAEKKDVSPTKSKQETDNHHIANSETHDSAVTEHKEPEHREIEKKETAHAHTKEEHADHSKPVAETDHHANTEHKETEKKDVGHDDVHKSAEHKEESPKHETEHKPTKSQAKEGHNKHEKRTSQQKSTRRTSEQRPEHHLPEDSHGNVKTHELQKSPKTGRESARKTSGEPSTKDRILEVRKMKHAYEEQLKSLTNELHVLSKQEKIEKIEKQIFSADLAKKTLARDPLNSQKNSAKLLRPIDKSAFDTKNKARNGRSITLDNEEAADQHQEGSEGPNKKLSEIKRVNRLNEEPLYMKMEKNYFDKMVCPELEKRKEALKQKREFAKPIELKDIKEHASKYQQAAKQEFLHKQMNRMEREAQEVEKAEKVINVYKSSVLKKVLENDEEEKIRDDKKAQHKKQLKDRQLQYGKLVKEMYLPKVDAVLRQGLQEKIQAEKAEEAMRRARQVNQPKTDYSGKTWKSKINYTTEAHSSGNVDTKVSHSVEAKSRVDRFLTKPKFKQDLSLPETLPESELPDAIKKINETLKEKIERGGSSDAKARVSESRDNHLGEEAQAKPKTHKVNPAPKKKEKSPERDENKDIKEVEKPKKVYTNYLDDVRRKRVEQEKNGAKVKYTQWEKHLKDKEMSYQDKVLNILNDVDRIEHQAKLKEEKLKHHDGSAEPADLEGQVTDMYLESIKAKLALIQGLS